jgi:hypothetical protein
MLRGFLSLDRKNPRAYQVAADHLQSATRCLVLNPARATVN